MTLPLLLALYLIVGLLLARWAVGHMIREGGLDMADPYDVVAMVFTAFLLVVCWPMLLMVLAALSSTMRDRGTRHGMG